MIQNNSILFAFIKKAEVIISVMLDVREGESE